MPFHLRWALPWLLKDRWEHWRIASIAGWCIFVLLTGYNFGWPAAFLVAALPGLSVVFTFPVLIDGVALALAALAALEGPWWQQIAFGLLAGAVSERAPLFAALWAWSPWPAVGLLSPVVRYLFWRPGNDSLASNREYAYAAEALIQPWRIGLQRNWRDLYLVAPWGGLLVALVWLDLRMGITLLIAYAQLFTATDTARLYQWAAPVLAAALVNHLDWRLCLILALVTWFNPWRGNGIWQ